MSKTITIRLSDAQYEKILNWAKSTHRPISNFITYTVFKFADMFTADKEEMKDIFSAKKEEPVGTFNLGKIHGTLSRKELYEGR